MGAGASTAVVAAAAGEGESDAKAAAAASKAARARPAKKKKDDGVVFVPKAYIKDAEASKTIDLSQPLQHGEERHIVAPTPLVRIRYACALELSCSMHYLNCALS